MRSVILVLSVIVAAFIACGFRPLRAEEAINARVIRAVGEHELKIVPQRLRLTLTIRAEAADAKSAIKSLSDHKRRVKEELVALKAEEASIEFGATRLTNTIAGMPEEMQQYGSQVITQIRRSANGRVPNLPSIYQATSSAKAEWALPTTDVDALALLPETLKEQVKNRDLMGEKNKAELDDTQQEQLEELQTTLQEQMGYYSSDDSENNSFVILFVAKVDNQSRHEAMKAAYEQAVAEAEMLAAATGQKLGPLISIRGDGSRTDALSENYQAYESYNPPTAARRSSRESGEVASSNPDELGLSVRVEAEFNME